MYQMNAPLPGEKPKSIHEVTADDEAMGADFLNLMNGN